MNLLEYFGRFHPLVVHLPIGFLSVFLILGLFISRQKQLESFQIVKLIILVSAISATASSISGYLLSISGDYNLEIVSRHQWLGISLTILNWLIYFKIKYLLNASVRNYRIVLGVVLVSLIFTGHLGGSLTHGSDFLIPPPPNQWFSSGAYEKKSISMNSTAFEATSIIFERRCYTCHGKNKQKGALRLDTREAILKGGENGEIISDNASNSLLIEKLLLPIDDEDHMPPKEKKQLTSLEISYLTWWIEAGVDFENSLESLNLPDSLHEILSKEDVKFADSSIPEKEVKPTDDNILEKLRSLGVIVTSVGKNSNYLSASFINTLPENSSEAMENLNKVKSQLIWLNLDYQDPDDDAWEKIGELAALRKLSVKNTNLSDENLASFQPLKELIYLNLVGTNVTVSGLDKIANLQKLESLYLYQTGMDRTTFESIQNLFPNAIIDTGNYFVPILESDTTVLTLQ